MTQARQDSLNARRLLTVGDVRYAYYSLQAAQEAGFGDITDDVSIDQALRDVRDVVSQEIIQTDALFLLHLGKVGPDVIDPRGCTP